MNDESKSRRIIYALFITVAAGMIGGRIMATHRVYEPWMYRADDSTAGRTWPTKRPASSPTFGSNDRSRWATIRALVDEGTYAVGQRNPKLIAASAVAQFAASGPLQAAALEDAAYRTRLERRETVGDAQPFEWANAGLRFEDGWDSVDYALRPDTLEYVSTKPPFLPTLLAGLYWLLQMLTGWTLKDNTAEVVRTILVLVNLLPFVIYLYLMSRLVDRFGKTMWGKLFVIAGACFATYATTFAITLNNHCIATYSVMFALYPAVRIWEHRQRGATPSWYLFALSGFFAAFAVCNELPAAAFAGLLFLWLLSWYPLRTIGIFAIVALIPIAGYVGTNYMAIGQWRPVQTMFHSEWYQFEGSHWKKPPPGHVNTGIDWAGDHETRAEYVMHATVGHHGWYSLTPIWLLAVLGMFAGMMSSKRLDTDSGSATLDQLPRFLFPTTLIVSVAVIGFYLVRTTNYGGWTSGFRWLMWLSPLWLLCMLPIADWMSKHRWSRGLAYLLLAMSIFSVSYPAWNPWRHPWIFDLMTHLGWKGY